ncbi:hypothetical protein DMENIID0001_073520 [Sergentomyia squamirostris]
MFISYVSLLWIVLFVCVLGRDIDFPAYPPCAFNPLCTCSKGIPDLGIVQCRNVPFPAIPRMVNTSKVFMLHMENNELQRIEPYFFQATGLYGLTISSNPISEIPDEAFTGLERSLWELHLINNKLTDIPTRAIRHLQKLRTLDLSMNQISYIDHESWRGLEDSLEQLILSENSLSLLPMDTFSGLHFLHTLDLSGNNLREIDGSVFRDGMDKLTKILLSNNLLTRIPYGQMSSLRSLKILDLSHNRIPTMDLSDNEYNPGIRLSLDILHLEYNTVEILQTGSFQYFDIINQTFLDGNPLKFINDDAFRQAKIRELYLRHCQLDFISPSAFGGLENTLQVLDMSGNNLSSIPEILFQQLFSLKSLGLRENRIKSIIPMEMFNGFQSTLLKLDLSGDTNAITSFQDLKRMRNLRSLALSKLLKKDLGPEDFFDFGTELENLKLSGGNIKSIKSHTFRHIRGIKRLDLSDNSISTLETDAFLEVGHALQSLKLSHAFASTFTTLPKDTLNHLTSLREFDMSNNKLKSISDTTFHFLRNLHHLNLQDNHIEQIVKGTFQGDIHANLESILMGFNNIKYIPQHSFVDLESARSIILSDNLIEKIERRAFMNLHQLRVLNLRGNKLTSISDEAFQWNMNNRKHRLLLERCRVCGVGEMESKNRHFLYGMQRNDELLTILRNVLPIVIYGEDPLSKWICTRCKDDVTAFQGISVRYTKYFGHCLDTLRNVNPDQTYLQICSDVETFAATLEDSLKEKVSSAVFNRKRIILPPRNVAPVTSVERQKEVQSLFKICIDYVNRERKDLFPGIVCVESGTAWSGSEVAESEISVNFEDDNRDEDNYYNISGVECNVNITEGYSANQQQPRLYQALTENSNENGIGAKRKLSRRSFDYDGEKPQTRPKSRVNYSEDNILDDVLLYEQIMLDEYKKKKIKTERRSRDEVPMLLEETVLYKTKQVATKQTAPKKNSNIIPINHIREQLKVDPTQVIQFNSHVSIHLKAKEIAPEPAWEPAHGGSPVDCKFCRKKFQSMTILARHQVRHFVLRVKRLDSPEILHPKFRRYSYRYPNFRCCNCLSYFVSKEALKSHWGKGECEFFCRICRASFHRSRPELHKHYFLAHGVRFNEAIFSISGLDIDESKICNICFCTFPNFQSRNSHMKIHKKKGDIGYSFYPSPSQTNFPASRQLQQQQQQAYQNQQQPVQPQQTSVGGQGSRPRLQINQALQMEIKRKEFVTNQRYNGGMSHPSSSQMASNHYRPPMPHIIPPQQRYPPAPPPAITIKRYSEPQANASSVQTPMGEMDFQQAKIYSCVPCGSKYPNKSELYRHKRSCTQLLRTCCHLCWKQFTTTSEFEYHMRNIHSS